LPRSWLSLQIQQFQQAAIWFRILKDWIREGAMEQTIFMICMFFGVSAVALIAITLLFIALGRVKV